MGRAQKKMLMDSKLKNFCHLLITFANSLDPDLAWQIAGPDLSPKLFGTLMVFLKEFFEYVNLKIAADNKKACKITQPKKHAKFTLSADILCKQFAWPDLEPNILDPDQARQNVGSDLGPNCLTL